MSRRRSNLKSALTDREASDQTGRDVPAQGGWFRLENEVCERVGRELGVHALGVYIVLARHADNSTRQCWPGRSRIARSLSCSTDTVDRAIKQLEAGGFILVERRTCTEHRRIRRRAADGTLTETLEPRRINASNLYTLLDCFGSDSAAHGGHPTSSQRPPVAATSGYPPSLTAARTTPSKPNPGNGDSGTLFPTAHAAGEKSLQEVGSRPSRSTAAVSPPGGISPAAGVAHPLPADEQRRAGELFEAFCHGKDIDPSDLAPSVRKRQARELGQLPGRFDADDVHAFVRWKRSNPYFADAGAVKIRHVLDDIAEWVANGRPPYSTHMDANEQSRAEYRDDYDEETIRAGCRGQGELADQQALLNWLFPQDSQELEPLRTRLSDEEAGRQALAIYGFWKRRLREEEERWAGGLQTAEQAELIEHIRHLSTMRFEGDLIPHDEVNERDADELVAMMEASEAALANDPGDGADARLDGPGIIFVDGEDTPERVAHAEARIIELMAV